MTDKDYYLIRGNMLPEVFVVIRAKKLLACDAARQLTKQLK